MATNTLKILREVNDYSQDFIAEDILGISQPTYARLEQNPSKLNGAQAQKLADLYKVSISDLLSEAAPIITFQSNAINNNPHGGNGYIQMQSNHIAETELTKAILTQNELLTKQNAQLMEMMKLLGGKLAGS